MSAFFSKSCEYGIQAVLFIAREKSTHAVHLKDIASELRLPSTFLSKILQKLTRAKIVRSQKGNQGGFHLARGAEEIALREIVLAIDGVEFLSECVIGFSECSESRPCTLHADWVPVREAIARLLSEKNIADLSSGIDSKIESMNPGYIARRLMKDAQTLRF